MAKPRDVPVPDDRDVISFQPAVDMPNYGLLNRLMSKGTMSRYRVVGDKRAGTLTWYSGDDTPKVYRLPGAPDDGSRMPVASKMVYCSFSRPQGYRYEGFVMLVDEHDHVLVRTFTYWDTKLEAQWAGSVAPMVLLGLDTVDENMNLRRLNKKYRGASPLWILQTPGWVLIPVVLAAIVVLAIIVAAIQLSS